VTGGLKVAEGGSMTASATFGAEIYSEGYGYSTLTLGATVGGTASGGGRFREGSSVEITALPESGYRFTGWTVQGSTAVTIANRFSARTTVTIPVDDVTIIANFEHIPAAERVRTQAALKRQSLIRLMMRRCRR
jgi:uncharacterized repeat protein (TIGR02543 family)